MVCSQRARARACGALRALNLKEEQMQFIKYVPVPFTESASLWMSAEFSCYILPAALILDFGPTCAVGFVVGPLSFGLRWASADLLDQYRQMEVAFEGLRHNANPDRTDSVHAANHQCCGTSAK